MIKKLDMSKYKILKNTPQIMEPVFIETSNISDVETEIKQEENIDDPLSLIKIEPIENDITVNDPGIVYVSASVKQEADMCDLESKIEIEEDLVLKTESSDLSEFIHAGNKAPSIETEASVSEVHQHDHTYAKSTESDDNNANCKKLKFSMTVQYL